MTMRLQSRQTDEFQENRGNNEFERGELGEVIVGAEGGLKDGLGKQEREGKDKQKTYMRSIRNKEFGDADPARPEIPMA
jgi:hypothetical protein